MTTSDKTVAAIGILTCITMLVTGWTGEKAFSAIISRKTPNPTPKEKKDSKTARKAHWKLPLACGVLFVESLTMLFLLWRFNRHYAVTFVTVLEICLAFLAMVFAIVIPLLKDRLDLIQQHIMLTNAMNDDMGRMLEVIEDMAGIIGEKGPAPPPKAN